LALFGRRPQQRGDSPSFRRPKTCTKAAILVGEAEQRRAAPEDALWMDAPDFAVAQAGLRIQSSI
jgi:hypothetical protein